MADFQCGSACKINGKNSYSYYSADLASFKVNGTDIIAEYFKSNSNSSITVLENKTGLIDIVAKFIVYGQLNYNPNTTEAVKNYNRLLEECKECTIEVEDEEFEFCCIMHSVKTEFTGIEGYYFVEINFKGIRRIKKTQTFSVSSSTTETYLDILNDGTAKSGVKIEVQANYSSPSAGMSGTIKIGDILINCPGNDKFKPFETIIIDGLNGTVTKQGQNYFINVEMFELPFVNPGSYMNQIKVEKSGIGAISITLTYYQTFDY